MDTCPGDAVVLVVAFVGVAGSGEAVLAWCSKTSQRGSLDSFKGVRDFARYTATTYRAVCGEVHKRQSWRNPI